MALKPNQRLRSVCPCCNCKQWMFCPIGDEVNTLIIEIEDDVLDGQTDGHWTAEALGAITDVLAIAPPCALEDWE